MNSVSNYGLVCKNSGLTQIPKEGLGIFVHCSKAEIKNISVWNFVSSETSDKRGNWFDVTENARGEFPVEGKRIVSIY